MNGPVVSLRTYATVFALLIALTFLTVGLSFLELGRWHAIVGLTIAAGKGLLVVLFFMHLLGSGRLNWLVIGSGLFWLGILMSLTLADYLTRHWLAY